MDRSSASSRRRYSVHSAGVDWITVTATDLRVRNDLHASAVRLLDAETDADNIRSAWRWKGYEGWQAGSVRAGEREDSYYCQVSGQPASLYWLTLLEAPVNVTRLDVQVTVVGRPTGVDLAREQWERIEADERLRRKAGWRSWITTRPAGSTLYVGSPRSQRRLRLYDKHAEQPDTYPPGAWRYEVQARDGLAGSIAAGLADSDACDVACVATVHKCFRARGVRPAFRSSGGGVLGNVPRSRSDAQRRLVWLDRQVSPTVAWLEERGFRSHARYALGLADD